MALGIPSKLTAAHQMNPSSAPTLGLAHMLSNADLVIWLTAAVLLVMSVISWTLIIAKGRAAHRLRQQIAGHAADFWQSPSLEEGGRQLQSLEVLPVMSPMVTAAIELQQHAKTATLDGASGWEDRVTRHLRSALHAATARLESGLVMLASIGATSPFVGLFGTVWSIYQALISISGSGQIMIEQVAGPVGEALIMTAFGLFVAIPAVLAYNALTRSNRIVLAELDAFANDLRALLVNRTD
ncbi:MAG: MotA/TolQ/ExbB proton channel family protein [Burkholderiaceae bacterium]|nr:MotA/TolQ/ExbB proton channel family protein [Burkholderiaceae bacterium]